MAASSVSSETFKNSNRVTLEDNLNGAYCYVAPQSRAETVDLSVKCRGCFAEEPEMHFLFTNFDQELSLAHILMQTTSFVCYEDDGLPPYFCIKCTACLVGFFNFKIQYQKTEIYIRNLLGKPSHSHMECITVNGESNPIKEEVSQESIVEHFSEDSMVNQHESDDHFSEGGLCEDQMQFLKKCSECKALFSIEVFKAHWETHKTKCCTYPECDYKAVRKPDLDLHMQARHSEDRNFVCQQCGVKFKTKQLLKRHEKRHLNLRNYCCETCGMRFNDLGPLKTHIKLKHIGTREFVCSICGLDFPLKATLDKHILRHNKNRPAPYNCGECSMRFQDKCSLQRHRKVKHSGEFVRPMCQNCGKTYCSVTKLKHHIERHHGDTPPVFKQRGRKPKVYQEGLAYEEVEEDFDSEWDSEEELEDNQVLQINEESSNVLEEQGEMNDHLTEHPVVGLEETITESQSEIE